MTGLDLGPWLSRSALVERKKLVLVEAGGQVINQVNALDDEPLALVSASSYTVRCLQHLSLVLKASQGDEGDGVGIRPQVQSPKALRSLISHQEAEPPINALI